MGWSTPPIDRRDPRWQRARRWAHVGRGHNMHACSTAGSSRPDPQQHEARTVASAAASATPAAPAPRFLDVRPPPILVLSLLWFGCWLLRRGEVGCVGVGVCDETTACLHSIWRWERSKGVGRSRWGGARSGQRRPNQPGDGAASFVALAAAVGTGGGVQSESPARKEERACIEGGP